MHFCDVSWTLSWIVCCCYCCWWWSPIKLRRILLQSQEKSTLIILIGHFALHWPITFGTSTWLVDCIIIIIITTIIIIIILINIELLSNLVYSNTITILYFFAIQRIPFDSGLCNRIGQNDNNFSSSSSSLLLLWIVRMHWVHLFASHAIFCIINLSQQISCCVTSPIQSCCIDLCRAKQAEVKASFCLKWIQPLEWKKSRQVYFAYSIKLEVSCQIKYQWVAW